jgi:hypothetical protein
MSVNVVSEYRKKYIKDRRKGADPESSHSSALENVYIQLLHNSAASHMPISDNDISLIKDLNNNPHYVRLLEDILDLPEDQQRDYLARCAKVPQLRLVK